MPLVSIIVPMYKCESYVTSVLQSLSSQSFTNIEIICVVDGSPDNTLEVAKAYEQIDTRVRVFAQKHGGAGAARNTGFVLSRGEYVMFLDADDLFPADYVSKMVEVAEKTSADITVCQYYRDDNYLGIKQSGCGFRPENVTEPVMSPEKIKNLFYSISSVPHNKLFRKNLIDNHGLRFSTTQIWNDTFFVLCALVSANKIAFISANLYTYRQYDNSWSISSDRFEYQSDSMTVFKELYTWLINNHLFHQYEDSFYWKWKDGMYNILSSDNSKPFIKKLAAYIANSEPFCHMDCRELERKGGLTTAKAKVAKLLTSNKRKRQRLDCFIRNMEDLRCELSFCQGKHIRPKDNIVRGIIWESKDIGFYHVLGKTFKWTKIFR